VPKASWQVFTWSDITTLAEVQEQLQRSRRLAVVGGIAAGVAHEINNPLAAITTCAEAIRRDLRRVIIAAGDDDEMNDDRARDNTRAELLTTPSENDGAVARAAREGDWRFYLEEIVRQSLRCKAITGGLLDLARERRADFVFVNVNEVVESCTRVFAPNAGDSVRFTFDLDPRLNHLLTDEGMLRQILDNLVGNALLAVADCAAIHDGEVHLATHAGDEVRVMIEVRDNGAGIAPENLARIFDPFWTTRHTGRSAGLGLAVCQTLAEILGGSISVESKPGDGSRFRLWLPRR